jgi:uncharacterized protein
LFLVDLFPIDTAHSEMAREPYTCMVCPPSMCTLTLALMLCVAELGCAKAADKPPVRTPLRMGSLAMTRLAGALEQLPDIAPQSVVAEGSVANLKALQQGSADIAVVAADVAYRGFEGQSQAPAGLLHPIRGIAVLNVNTLYLIAAPHTRIKSINDLRGLRVVLGSTGSVTPAITELLLEASGLSQHDVHGQVLPYADTLKRLSSGNLDAAFESYNPAVLAATSSGGRLIDIHGPAIERLREGYPFLQSTLVIAGTFPGQTKPLRTVGIDLLLVCRANLDEGLVYRVVKKYFEVLQRSTPATDLERAPATPIPLHPGAARYYRERVLSR